MSAVCSRCGGPQDCNHRYCRKCKAAYAREWRQRNPLSLEERRKEQCREATRYEVRYGRMAALPCYLCGITERVESHHEDYSNPYTVVWLCEKHHGLVSVGWLCLIGTLQQAIGQSNLSLPKNKQKKFPMPPKPDIDIGFGGTMRSWEAEKMIVARRTSSN